MEKFKVGDRVRVIGKDCGEFYNKTGTIIDIPDYDNIEILVDNYIKKYQTFFSDYNLELISKHKKDKSTEACVLINPPAVILFKDGKKYVAKAQDEPFDAERGLMVALLKSFGIGYKDLQKMLKNAKQQNLLSLIGRKGDSCIRIKISDDTPITAKMVPFAQKFDEVKRFCGLEQKPKKKSGRPRKTQKTKQQDETPKPKRPRGRPVKLRIGDEVEIIPTSNGRYAFGDISSEDLRLTYYIEFIGDRFLRVGNTDNRKSFIVDKDEVRLIERAR